MMKAVTHANLRRSNRPKITCITQSLTEGGGSQLHKRISTWAFAASFELDYLHSPLTSVDHSEGDNWLEQWNSLLDFERALEICPPLTFPRTISASRLVWKLLLSREMDTIWVIENPHFFSDVFPEAIHRLRPKLREIFDRKSPVPTAAVGVHLRLLQPRDVEFTESRHSNATRIFEFLGSLGFRGEEISIFVSPSSRLESVQLPRGVQVCTDGAIETFSQMVSCKHLIIGKSSLSYVSGLLNNNVVFYEEFWHPGMPDWKRVG